jgi:hypothetical protein
MSVHTLDIRIAQVEEIWNAYTNFMGNLLEKLQFIKPRIVWYDINYKY